MGQIKKTQQGKTGMRTFRAGHALSLITGFQSNQPVRACQFRTRDGDGTA